MVAAPFPHDENWYRARIVGVSGSTLDLLFVDFGDTATVDIAVVKSLRLQYYRLPVQAIPCRVAGVQPKGQSLQICRYCYIYSASDNSIHTEDFSVRCVVCTSCTVL